MNDTHIAPRRPGAESRNDLPPPRRVPAAVANRAVDAAPRVARLQSLAAVSVRRSSVAGAAAAKQPVGHVVGGARGAGGGSQPAAADAAKLPPESVALADGTSITFGSVRLVPEPELAESPAIAEL